jgi:predicted CDP-diglyceride synthetase/phosphatidate cytidylyltransferase
MSSQKPNMVAPMSDGPELNQREVCIANISPRERLKRLIGGVIPFVIALAILTWLISINANRLWRLPLLILFMGAGSGFFQWRDKT